MSDPNDPFLVTSPLGIKSVLRALVSQNTLVHMRLEQDAQAIITTLLDVHTEQKHIIVDAATDADFNQRLTQSPIAHFDAQVNGVRVQFRTDGQAQPYTFDQRDAFLLPYPDALRRLQRRDHFRIDVPVSSPLFCSLSLRTGQDVSLPVKDISAGGVALLDRNEVIVESEGSLLKNCTFELDDVGTVVVDLRIRRISHQLLGDGKATRVVACEFYQPAPADAIMVQNYIGRLERMLNARRRGFD